MSANGYKFQARDLSCVFGSGKGALVAVDNVSFNIKDQSIVSIVGGSGCGKTVLAKMLLNLQKPTSGELQYDGKTLSNPKNHWKSVQCIFQDPFSAFNQFFNVEKQLKMSFNLFTVKPSKSQQDKIVRKALEDVNLKPDEFLNKYPFELSGGQMQRLLIARIFIIRPQVLIADEPTSMVDACSRSNILDYLLKLKKELKMTIVFITHDLGLAYYVSDTIMIMDSGKIIEQGDPDQVTFHPKHPKTIQLLEDIPQLNREWIKH
ncbi:MAG: ATP-binding cassette domain-containing protein [Fibrobacterales bacterium]